MIYFFNMVKAKHKKLLDFHKKSDKILNIITNPKGDIP